MRKTYIIALIALIVFGASSCTEWLDLRPESEIILDDYWQTEADVDAVLASCYRGLTEDAVISRMMAWGEIRSDNMTAGANTRYDFYRIFQGDLTPTNAYCAWGSFYSVINYCNTLLHYAPLVVDRDDNFTKNDLHGVEAEARAIRALSYFYLVRTFKEVPWMDQASIADDQNYAVAKQPEDTIIKHIKEDLIFAQQYARTDYGLKSYNKGRVTLNMVNTLLADVYLWNKEYDKCSQTCDLVLADSKLALEPYNLAYSHIFYLGNSTESIFELQFSEDVMRNTAIISSYGSYGNKTGEISFPTTLAYDLASTSTTVTTGAFSPFNFKVNSTVIESAKDIRAKESYVLNGGKFHIFKYAGISHNDNLVSGDPYSYRTTTPNWIVYRLSDVILMKAEAVTELEGTENYKTAVELVNQTYLRSNFGEDSLLVNNYATKSEVEKLVMRERHREFLFEGKRWFDLVRLARREGNTSTLNDFVDHKSTGTTASLGAPVMDAMYMPIAKSELKANKNLKQNPYYETTSSSSR